jgi:hypothetical protein
MTNLQLALMICVPIMCNAVALGLFYVGLSRKISAISLALRGPITTNKASNQ